MPHLTIVDPYEAYDLVLDNSGATLPRRDAVDERIVRVVRTGVIEYADNVNLDDIPKFEHRRLPDDSYKLGIITDISQVGGYPEYNGTPYKDTDGDGMPDWWEIKYGLNPNDPADANGDLNGDGYTNIEKFINGINPEAKIDWTNPMFNYDTLKANGNIHKQ